MQGYRIDPTILREYDIRGVVGEKPGGNLGAGDARAIGRSFATLVRAQGGGKVVVGRDGRLSSPILEAALVEGLTASGVDVVRIGISSSPMLYFAELSAEDVQGGIQITGSHNPADQNGFKMVMAGRPFYGAAIQRLGELAAAGEWSRGAGRVEDRSVIDAYVEGMLGALADLPADRLAALKIGWDAGNGAAGPVLERLTARLPGEHHLLHTDVDGTFPNHHPDPSEEANLADLRALVAAKKLDFGVAFDGDADRIGVIDGQGRALAGDQLLLIYAEDVLRKNPGARVIADVKASRVLFDRVAALGGVPDMWKTGHALIKSRMKQTGAVLAGEMTGHMFFADDYHGFDDAFYAALRLMAAILRLDRSVAEFHDAMPQLVSTPELRFAVGESRKFAAVEEVRGRLAEAGAEVVAVDGVRVTTADGWWLLRASNTQAMLVARAESETPEGLARLVGEIDRQLAASGLSR
ncbi:phosphoglucomutase/phosphomannomutase PgmG [Novosphingobium sp. KA1]|uniref:phosphoglucomutase/phosphomannomutase PgmG n=1 Tax=Novosphingobium sp. (strain KA1) TaxID=164608 RepID=UPI001A8C664D|nr:phosphomannomutase/phosphoglucomutase [Novosphingobium sp. KA1]QSR16738.1 phosphomannomutase [Novosphingobium sp. KA1]